MDWTGLWHVTYTFFKRDAMVGTHEHGIAWFIFLAWGGIQLPVLGRATV